MLPALMRAPRAFGQDEAPMEGDAGIIAGLAGLEESGALAYATALQAGLLKSSASAAELFRSQKRQHAAALTALLEGLGGTVPAPPRPEDLPGLSEVKTEPQFLSFAVGLENNSIAASIDALMNVGATQTYRPITEIMANDGQHLVVLRQALGSNPVPSAFPSGIEKG